MQSREVGRWGRLDAFLFPPFLVVEEGDVGAEDEPFLVGIELLLLTASSEGL